MPLLRFSIFFTLLISNSSLSALIDLEENPQNFVKETKRVIIAGHPHAFNPTVIKWRGFLLMSFREIYNFDISNAFPWNSSLSGSQIGIVWLDDNFNPEGEPQILQLNGDGIPGRSEDPRLLTVGERLYLVYSDNNDAIITPGGFRMHVVELDYDGETFHVLHNECLFFFKDENSNRREKNWTPFEYHKHLLFSYSLEPHQILYPILGTGFCKTIASTKGHLNWKWGELRGGTPGFLVDDEYLAFFHSSIEMASVNSNGENMLHYFMGAYTFEKKPPFRITKISSEPIVGENFYNGETYIPYWKPVRVVFPCGFFVEGNSIWVSYGRQDHEIWLTRLDKKALFKSLVPVLYE